MNTYSVSKECIGCRACVGIAGDNFDMKGNTAYLKKQPLTEEDERLCQMAEAVCPTNAISKTDAKKSGIFDPKSLKKSNFPILDVRNLDKDPFDTIVKRAYETGEGDGFVLIQKFLPYPVINMLAEMGFDYKTEKKSDSEFRVYFYKKERKNSEKRFENKKVDVVIQSATPVAYPIIIKLLHSQRLKNAINVKELKVWEETEKHLAWITNKKADISFSAIITASKLKNSDIKIPALFVWDNFVLLSRKRINGFEDLRGEKIYLPLFKEAPPAKITKYLIKTRGLNPDDFIFVYGKPFGRPEKIYRDFVDSKVDTVVLREPEASYAIKTANDQGEDISVISYNKLWNEANKGFGMFPNAGVVFKGEFAKKYPEIAAMFLDELKSAIEWVKNNKKDAARLSCDAMRQPMDRVELFLNRVNFEYVEGERLINKVKDYFDILNKNGIENVEADSKLLDMFKL